MPKCAKKHAFSTRFELLTQCLTTNEYDPSLNCAVGSIARQVEHDQCFPIFCSLDVSQGLQNQIEAIGYGIANEPRENCKNKRDTVLTVWMFLTNEYDPSLNCAKAVEHDHFGQIEGCFSRSPLQSSPSNRDWDCFYLNEPLENCKNTGFSEFC